MKSKRTLVLAASILALTLSAFPQISAAGTGITPQAGPDLMRQGGGKGVKYMAVIVAAGNLISSLVP